MHCDTTEVPVPGCCKVYWFQGVVKCTGSSVLYSVLAPGCCKLYCFQGVVKCTVVFIKKIYLKW